MDESSKGHLCYYDRDSNQLKLYFADENNPASLFAPSIRYYYTDRQQNVWITNDRGVDKISFYPNKYRIRPIDNGLEIRAFLADKQKRLWVASKKGNVRIYRPDGTLEGYLSPQGIITPQEVTFGKVCTVLWKINKEIYGWEPKRRPHPSKEEK